MRSSRYLTKDEELALFHVLRTGSAEERSKAESELFDSQHNFVMSMVGKYKPVGVVDYDDMLQCGSLGLLTAIRKFDPSKGTRLSTYAGWWIRQMIRREQLGHGYTIRLPDDRGFEGHRNQKVMHLGSVVPIGNKGELTTLEQSLVDEFLPETSPLEDEDNRAELMSAVTLLTPKQRYVITERFGLNESREAKTLEQIGKVLKVTREMVRRTEQRALQRLRKMYSERKLKNLSQK